MDTAIASEICGVALSNAEGLVRLLIDEREPGA
jgi:hypothetical protein